MMDGLMDGIIVQTCLRSGVNYLPETLKSIDDSGACRFFYGQRYVLSDGPVEYGSTIRNGWDLKEFLGPSGTTNALFRSIRFAHEMHWKNLYYFEDDIVMTNYAFKGMLDCHVPTWAAFVSFYDAALPEGMPRGLWPVSCIGPKERGFWGSLALKIPEKTLATLASIVDPLAFNCKWRGNRNAGDRILGAIMADTSRSHYAQHIPSLVNHRGDVSAVEGRETSNHRRARNWQGGDF